METNLPDKIERNWFENENVVDVARQLLGKVLGTSIGGTITKGKIVETEAYSGDNDKACHANGQKKTKRNKVMFEPGGLAYVYLCYGIHNLFNVVTNKINKADAVLIRALEPLCGIETMLMRRNMSKIEKRLTSGPGVLTEALGISLKQYDLPLDGDTVWIEDAEPINNRRVIATTRIGVEYAEEDALKPWRFYIKENKWVSRF